MNATLLRGIETFVFVFIASFIAAITAGGQPIDITTAVGQQQILTALLASVAVAFRQIQVTRNATPPTGG